VRYLTVAEAERLINSCDQEFRARPRAVTWSGFTSCVWITNRLARLIAATSSSGSLVELKWMPGSIQCAKNILSIELVAQCRRNRSQDPPLRQISDIEKSAIRELAAGFAAFSARRPKFLRQRPGSWPLTSRNVAPSRKAGSHPRETVVAGWAERIRTAMCQNSAGCGRGK
jgi:hypothetical protein